MKRIILIAILLTASVCIATPIIICDPNDNIESPTNNDNIIATFTIEITKEQYAAMQYLGMSFTDVINQGWLSRTFSKMVSRANEKLTALYKFTELKAKIEETTSPVDPNSIQ